MNDYQIWKNVSKISIISLVLTFLAEFYIVILENFDKLSDIGSFSAINHALNLFSRITGMFSTIFPSLLQTSTSSFLLFKASFKIYGNL